LQTAAPRERRGRFFARAGIARLSGAAMSIRGLDRSGCGAKPERGAMRRPAFACIGPVNGFNTESSRCPDMGIVIAAANRGRIGFSARSATAQQE